MKFSELLTDYIGRRSLEEVAQACRDQGAKIDQSYLSRLRSGKRPPPDDEELVKTIAQVCEQDPEPLMMLALIERQPARFFSELAAAALYAMDQMSKALTGAVAVSNDVMELLVKGEHDEATTRLWNAMNPESEVTKNLAAATRYRDRAETLMELVPFSELKLPVTTYADLDTYLDRNSDPVAKLAKEYGVPAVGIRAAIAAMQAAVPEQEPVYRVDLPRSKRTEGDEQREGGDHGEG